MKTQTLHALLIGINRYPAMPGKDLRGCVNDAQVMADLLRDRFGFPTENIELLLDEAATHDGILEAFNRLAERVGPGDQAVIFYAGHGSRVMTDAGFVEALVAHDSGRGSAPNRDVLDIEVDAAVQRLNQTTPYVTLLFDCCHSGSVTRDMAATHREIEPDLRVRSLDEPGAMRGEAPRPFTPGVRDTVLVAACQASELAAEYTHRDAGDQLPEDAPAPRVHGALTWFLSQALARASGPTTWRAVFEAVTHRLTARFPRQHPQLEGRGDLRVFGTDLRPADQVLRVMSVVGGQAVLSGGAAHGVVAGSRWALQDPLGGEPISLTVAAVGALDARGPVAALVEAGWVAEPIELVLPTPRLRVAIEAEGGPASALANALAASSLTEVGLGSLVARSAGSKWQVLDDNGEAVLPEHLVGDEAGVAADLARLARFRSLLVLDSGKSSVINELEAGVSLDVVRVQGGHRSPAEAVHADGLPAFEEGQEADFVLRNTTDAAVYVTLLQFGTDCAIELLVPLAGHPTWRPGGLRLEPGEAISVVEYYRRDPRFRGLGAGLPLHLPPGFPWIAGSADRTGHLTLRLLVTRTPADFEFLAQPGTRATPGGHLLEQLVSLYATGTGSRSFLPAPAQAIEAEWFAHSRTLAVSRPSGRQLDPGGSGKVLFYRLVVGTQELGQVGITAPVMSGLPTDMGFWKTLPTLLPTTFQLVPGDEVGENLATSRLGTKKLTSPPFETSARLLEMPTGVLRSWRVMKGSTLIGYLAQTPAALHWFGLLAGPRLPRTTLTFVQQSLPTGGAFYHATDHAV